MRVVLLAGILLAATSALAQTPTVKLIPSKPTTTITLTSVAADQAIAAIASDCGIEAEFDADIPAEELNRELTVRFVNARCEEVLSFLANQTGLTYRVIDAQTVRFEKKR